MRKANRIIKISALLLLLVLIGGCSGEDPTGTESTSTLDVEGVYDGTLDYSKVDNGWFQLNEISYNISLDGDKMLLASNIEDNGDYYGSYDSTKNEFICIYTGESEFDHGVITINFFEEDGIIKAVGEMVVDPIDEGASIIIGLEMVKRSD